MVKKYADRMPGIPPEMIYFMVDAPEGTYQVDGLIRRLEGDGLLLKIDVGSENIIHVCRDGLLRAVEASLQYVSNLYGNAYDYASRKKIYDADMALVKSLQKLVRQAENEKKYILPSLTPEQKARFKRQPAAETARLLIEQLKELATFERPRKQKLSAADYHAQYFVWEMRDLWQSWTGTQAQKSGGVRLIELSAAICRDTNTFSERHQDGSLEEWLGKRFMANWDPAKRSNLA